MPAKILLKTEGKILWKTSKLSRWVASMTATQPGWWFQRSWCLEWSQVRTLHFSDCVWNVFRGLLWAFWAGLVTQSFLYNVKSRIVKALPWEHIRIATGFLGRAVFSVGLGWTFGFSLVSLLCTVCSVFGVAVVFYDFDFLLPCPLPLRFWQVKMKHHILLGCCPSLHFGRSWSPPLA